jgi:hypothetical protein
MGALFSEAVLCRFAFAQGYCLPAAQQVEGSGLLVYNLDGYGGGWWVAEPAEATLVGLCALNKFFFTKEATASGSAHGAYWLAGTTDFTKAAITAADAYRLAVHQQGL